MQAYLTKLLMDILGTSLIPDIDDTKQMIIKNCINFWTSSKGKIQKDRYENQGEKFCASLHVK